MKILIALFLIYLVVCITACNSKKNKFLSDQSWQSLTIIDDQSIVFNINNDEDSSIVQVRNIGSIFTPRPKKKSIDTLKIYFTKSEKDTLAYLVNSLIVNPAKVKSHCTEFVGTIELTINYGQFKQYGKYDSTCDWSLLSDQTKQLNNILQRNIKKSIKDTPKNKP